MGKVNSFRDLIVWKKSHELTLEIYKTTKFFPSEEKFGISSQIRRAAYSISANIVEGHPRKTKKEFIQFLSIAKGSLEESIARLPKLKDCKIAKMFSPVVT